MAFSSCLPSRSRLVQLVEESPFLFSSDSQAHDKTNASEDWNSLQNAIVGLFQKKKIGDKGLLILHANVRRLLSTKTGSFLFEWYHKKPLTKGMIILRENIRHTEGKELLKVLEKEWLYFFTEILPMLQAIFHILRKSGISVRQVTQIAFRDLIVLKVNLAEALAISDFKTTPGLKHMFLILQNIHDSYPPNERRLQLESMVARIIVPYLGFQGYFNGGEEPLIESCEPILACRRRSSGENRRITRPLSVQTPQYETFEDIIRTAAARTNSVSDV